jgi:hypothetical protein
MPTDEGKIARQALAAFRQDFEKALTALAESYPNVIRRGVMALLEEPLDAAAKRQQREAMMQLGADPVAFDQALEERITATSFQEVVDLLSSGRRQNQNTQQRQ